MANIQYWVAETEDGTHTVSYTSSFWSCKCTLTVDGDAFVQKCKPFHIGAARREIFRLGDEQCVLVVGRNGKAEILLRAKSVPEMTVKHS